MCSVALRCPPHFCQCCKGTKSTAPGGHCGEGNESEKKVKDYIMITGWWLSHPSEKYESMGRIIPYIMENKKCSKPPTRLDYCNQQIKRGNAVINSPGNRVGRDLIGDGPGDNLYPRWTSTVNMEHAKKISASVTASLNDLQFEYPFVNLYDNICPKMEQTSELQVKR